MEKHKEPKAAISATNDAISEIHGLIFGAFIAALSFLIVAALFIVFISPYVLSLLLGNPANDATKIAAGSFVSITSGLLTTLFFRKWSENAIKNKVESAIKAVVQSEMNEFRKPYVRAGKERELRLQEYACAIPRVSRTSSSDKLNGQDSQSCHKSLAREVITQSLNSNLLHLIALASTKEITGKGYSSQFKKPEQDLHGDIYIYLKAWLMTSIKYGYDYLPVDCIKQRYQDPNAYIKAFEFIRRDCIRVSKIENAITEAIRSNEKDIRYSDFDAVFEQAGKVLDEYLVQLITALKYMSTQR